MRCVRFLLAASLWTLVGCLAVTSVFAQEVTQRWAEGPSVTVVPTVGNRVLFGGGSAIKWFDISDPGNPTVLSNGAQVEGTVRALATGVGNRLLIAVGYAGVMGGNADGLAFTTPPLDTPGHAYDAVLVGETGYIADGIGGLRVVDAEFTTSLNELGFVDVGGSARSVVVVGSTAYVAAGSAGLVTVDVSIGSNPMVLGSASSQVGNAVDVQVAGSHAYVADSERGLLTFDISNPAAPAFEVGHRSHSGQAVLVDGDRLFLADGAAGVAVFDLTDPADPRWLGAYGVPEARELAVLGDVLLVASGAAGLVVVDRNASPNLARLGTWVAPDIFAIEGAKVLEYSAPFAILGADWVTGVIDGWNFHVVNVSDPAAPTLARSFGDSGPDTDPRRITSVEVIPPYVYMTDDWNGFQVWDALSGGAPSLVGDCTGCAGSASALESEGAEIYALSASATGRLDVLDISIPTAPVVDGDLPLPATGRDLDVAGTRGLVANDEAGLRVLDLTDGTDPMEVGSLAMQGRASAVDSVGDLAWVAAREGGLKSVDVATTTAPSELGVYRPAASMPVTRVIAGPAAGTRSGSGTWAMVASDGTWFADVSSPARPTTLAYAPFFTDSFQFSGTTAYVGYNEPTDSVPLGLRPALETIDLTNLNTSAVVGQIAAGGPARAMATAASSTVLVAAGDGGLEIADLGSFSALDSPLLSTLDTGGRANDVASLGDLALVADGARGLVLVDISDPAAPVEIGAYVDLEGEAILVTTDGVRAFLVSMVRISPVTFQPEWTLTVIDISTPSAPTFVGRLSDAGVPQDVDFGLGHVWLALEIGGLRIIDVTAPAAPAEVADVSFARTRGVQVDGDLAFIAAGFDGMFIYDVSTPSSPVQVGLFDTPGHASDVAVDGSIVYLTDGLNGLQLVDVSLPAMPTDAGSVAIIESAEEVAIGLGQVFVASADAGISVVSMSGLIFADGFESGGLTAWSESPP